LVVARNETFLNSVTDEIVSSQPQGPDRTGCRKLIAAYFVQYVVGARILVLLGAVAPWETCQAGYSPDGFCQGW